MESLDSTPACSLRACTLSIHTRLSQAALLPGGGGDTPRPVCGAAPQRPGHTTLRAHPSSGHRQHCQWQQRTARGGLACRPGAGHQDSGARTRGVSHRGRQLAVSSGDVKSDDVSSSCKELSHAGSLTPTATPVDIEGVASHHG